MDDDKGPQMSPWMRSLAIWVAILAALALFVSIFEGRSGSNSGETIAYSDFVTRVEQGTVKSVLFTAERNAEIERSIREINEAIQRSSRKRK